MSWQSFVDDSLIGTGHVSAAAITSHDGSVLGQSCNFPQITPEEINGIMNGFADPGSLHATGLHLGGTRYIVSRTEPPSIYGKKGHGGVAIRKTNTVMIIGIYDESTEAGECTQAVEKLGDYLDGVGY